MNLRHQSSAMCVIMLRGEDAHSWSAMAKGVNSIPATFSVDQFYILIHIIVGNFGSEICPFQVDEPITWPVVSFAEQCSCIESQLHAKSQILRVKLVESSTLVTLY